MQMNPGIILSGQPFNALGAIQSGNEAAAQTNALQRQNQLANLYQTQGAGILNGDQGAMNALAGIDPMAAMSAQGAQLGMQGQRQDMAFGAEKMQMLRDQAKAAAAEKVAGMDAASVAAEREKLATGLKGAAFYYQKGDQAGYNAFLQQQGVDPAQFPFEAFPAHAATMTGVMDALEAFTPEVAKPADDYQRYVQEETASGRQPLTRIDYSQAIKGKGTTVYDSLTGRPVLELNGGSGSDRPKPSDPAAMIDTIDGILNDPALSYSTGMGAVLQNIPGTPMRRFGARADQLSGQAFLQAFESLKGGGQITEIEGQKATQAIGRLDTSQSAADYKEALQELRAILEAAQARMRGQDAAPQVGAPAAVDDLSEEELRYLGGN